MLLIGSRSRPRPTGSPSHRLALMPVRDAGRCGRGSGGRLASLGGDGQLRLTGSRAIPRGGERRPCWAVRAALVGGWGWGGRGRGRWGRCVTAEAPVSHGSRLAVASGRRCNPLKRPAARRLAAATGSRSGDRLPQRTRGPPEPPAGAGRERGPEA